MFDQQAFFRWLAAKKNGLHHRQILVVELPEAASKRIVDKICEQYSEVTVMFNEHLDFQCDVHIPITRYQDYLGRQTDALVFDATAGVHLNALYAGAGMVRRNGLIVILLRTEHAENEAKNSVKYSFAAQQAPSNFIKILKDRVQKFNGCFINENSTILPSSKTASTNNSHIFSENRFPSIENVNASLKSGQQIRKLEFKNSFKLSNDQTKIADKILSTITTECRSSSSIAVILGARGRGKSTLIGIIAAKLTLLGISSTKPFVLVSTALHKNQLTGAHEAYTRHCRQNSLLCNDRSINFTLPFYSPDEIITLAPSEAIVVIDEIASIAPDLLKKIVSHFSHVVIAGTTLGYEGSGNGFIKRVLPFLQSAKKTNVYELSSPFRWLKDDPVEACFADILSSEYLKADVRQFPVLSKEIGNSSCRLLLKSELIENSSLYHQLFSLLTQAHYQTTPNDIVRTLDANECKIFIVQNNCKADEISSANIIAVAVVFEEGGLKLASLAKEISLGKRRVQGHLTAQSLALHLFSPEVCVNTYLRINRIAVHKNYCRKGIASQLLTYCQQYAIRQNVDYMSVSFGYTPWLYKFWLHNNYVLAKIGQRIDTASGTASLLMIKSLSKTGNISLPTLRERIHLDIDYYSEFNKRLATLFNEIITAKSLHEKFIQEHTQFLKLLRELYVHNYINFQKFAPGLLRILKLSNIDLSSEKQTLLYEIFLRLHQKGIHKEEKQDLEKKLINSLIKD